MAILTSSGFYGFICSAARKAGEYVGTFISGVSGWMIKVNGDAEFKSIYARDKITTNEYVYNRIRVTEDEEVVTSNGKIRSATDNEDGTYTVYLDLREGDVNPFEANDLLQGYYHSSGNTETVYAVQNITVQADPDTDQSMLVTCEEGSIPYQYMVIVRVGNTINIDRQAFIKISSRTNCQYFFDGIKSFSDLDNPDKIKCAIGKADVGLIPAWAATAIGSIKKWFGLIADGVILRGTFVLKSSGKTVETELETITDIITDVETRFEVREGQISSKVSETKTYAENANSSAGNAADSAASALNAAALSEAAKVITIEKASEAIQTVDGFTQTVTEKTEIVVNAANSAYNSALAAAGSASASEAAKVITTEKASEAIQTVDGFTQTVTEKTEIVVDAANNAYNSALAAAGSASASEAAKVITIEKAAEAKQTAEGFTQTVTETTQKAVDDAIAGADASIEEKVGTAVTQSAHEWKVEVMGSDPDGNPNTILSAINADKSGVKIEAEKIQIDGFIFKDSKICSQDLNPDTGDANISFDGRTGKAITKKGLFFGSLGTPYISKTYLNNATIELTDEFNLVVPSVYPNPITVKLPVGIEYNGYHCSIVNPGMSSAGDVLSVVQTNNQGFLGTGGIYNDAVNKIEISLSQIAKFEAIPHPGDATKVKWCCTNYKEIIHEETIITSAYNKRNGTTYGIDRIFGPAILTGGQRISTGVYQFNHNIGHRNYTVHGTSYDSDYGGILSVGILDKQDTYFRLNCIDTNNGQANDRSFDFVINIID